MAKEDTRNGYDPPEPDADDGRPNSSTGADANAPSGNHQNNAPNHTGTPVHQTVPRHSHAHHTRRGA